jgi:hypothetical protein
MRSSSKKLATSKERKLTKGSRKSSVRLTALSPNTDLEAKANLRLESNDPKTRLDAAETEEPKSELLELSAHGHLDEDGVEEGEPAGERAETGQAESSTENPEAGSSEESETTDSEDAEDSGETEPAESPIGSQIADQ